MNINFGTEDTPVSECLSIECVKNKIMIVEGLYEKGIKDKTDITYPLSIQGENIDQLNQDVYMKCAKCLWYNTRNELQSEFINLELLTEL